MDIQKYTTKGYWDDKYLPGEKSPLDIKGARNLVKRRLFETLQKAGLEGKRVLEIGAGDSQWLPFLSREYPESTFYGLDYSQQGCDELSKRLQLEGGSVEVVCADMFSPPDELLESFDLVYSIGVVEHFDHLPTVLESIGRFLKPGGLMVTEIPNMNGIPGWLTRKLNLSVYQLHNPHNLESLVTGHENAGFIIRDSGYIGSNDFRVLSSCINENSSYWKKTLYLSLSRFTKLIGFFEASVRPLPSSAILSPIMYCAAEKQ